VINVDIITIEQQTNGSNITFPSCGDYVGGGKKNIITWLIVHCENKIEKSLKKAQPTRVTE
jgi:hypothetical protein